MPNTITIKSDVVLNGQDAEDFFAFLTTKKELGVSYFKQGSNSIFAGNQILFEQNFLCENAVEGAYYTGSFVGKKIGNGGSGTVYHIDKVVEVTNLGFMPSGYTQPQVVKVQQHCSCSGQLKSSSCQQHNAISMLNNEMNLVRKTPHLHPRQPIIDSGINSSYTIMDEVPGRELFDILIDDINKKNSLTLQQRMDLSVELLQTVLKQVKECHFIHRDLKPENIMVVLGSPILVNIVDYGSAIEILDGSSGILNGLRVGSPSYMAPEVFVTKGSYVQTYAQDAFAVGRILAIIWGGFDNSYKQNFYTLRFGQDYLENLKSLFHYIPSEQRALLADLKIMKHISDVLKQMHKEDPKQRISIERALDEFQKLQTTFTREQDRAVFSSVPGERGDARFFATKPVQAAATTAQTKISDMTTITGPN